MVSVMERPVTTVDPSLLGANVAFAAIVRQEYPEHATPSLEAQMSAFNDRFHGLGSAAVSETTIDPALLMQDNIAVHIENLSYDHLRRKDLASLAILSYDPATYAFMQHRQQEDLFRWEMEMASDIGNGEEEDDDEDD